MNCPTHRPSSPIKRAFAGFTLIELMIVVGIMAILAVVAIPSYLEQVRKAQRTEAKARLLEVAQAQERFFTAKAPPKEYTMNILADLGIPTSTENNYYTLSVLPETGGCPDESCYVLQATRNQTRDIYDLRLRSNGLKESSKNGSSWQGGWP